MRMMYIAIAAVLLLVASAAFAQEAGIPAATEDQETAVPSQRSYPLSGAEVQTSGSDEAASIPGVLMRTFTLSEVVQSGSISDNRIAFSGTLAYEQDSAHRSFSIKYAGGLLFDSLNSIENQNFHNLTFSESFALRRWNLLFGDTVSYLPQAPLNGASGITGLGSDPSVPGFGNINPGLLPSESILTFDSARVNNASFAEVQYHTSRNTSVTSVISYGLLRYVDNDALDNHQLVVTTGLDHEMRRSKLAIKYSYSRFAYDVIGGSMEVHAAQLMFSQLLGRNFSANVSGGPQLIQPHSLGGSSSVVGAGAAGLTYEWNRYRAGVRYSRGVNNGSGLLTGGLEDSVQASVTRRFRFWRVECYGTYLTTSGVSQSARVISRSAGGQLSRDLGPSLGTYLSYTYQVQQAGNLCLGDTCAFDDSLHTVGFGFYWHPRGMRFSH